MSPHREMTVAISSDGTLPPTIVTILVNWNGYADTIECLESLFSADYPRNHLVVVDNGSKDDSLTHLAAWAMKKGLLPTTTIPDNEQAPESSANRSLSFSLLSLDDVNQGRGWEILPNLVLIDAEKNWGFAGGVNIGLRFALLNNAVDYAWILNNDTVVASDCLSKMEYRMSQDVSAGMCGSRILYYSQRNTIQALGGARFNPWLGGSYLIGTNEPTSSMVNRGDVERRLDHLSGASMLVSRSFLQTIGLMDEEYFLYYEEADWAMRGKGLYRLVYADDAIVYHKEGASIGSSHQRAKRSPVSAYFMVRSRIRFTRKFFPFALFTVMAYSALATMRARIAGHRDQANAMLSALRGLNAEQAIGWGNSPDKEGGQK